MPRPDPPSADAPIVVGLAAAVSGMVGFACFMVWLMQPTVLPNAPFVAGTERYAAVVPRSLPTTVPDVEQSAIAAAARENDLQGFPPIVLAMAEPAPVQAQPAPPTEKQAKPKRAVARAPKRNTQPVFASNPWGGGHSMFGGFGGGWFR